jgi:hypothetical protein
VAETARVQVEALRIAAEVQRWEERARQHQECAAATRAFIAHLQQQVIPEHEQAAAEAMRKAEEARAQLARRTAPKE